MTTTTDTTVAYSAALALEVAFAVQELLDARAAYEANPCVKTEAREYLATLKLAKPEHITALLKEIDRLEDARPRVRRGR